MDYEGGTAENAPSASASGGKYEVFLSFTGKDTRKGFTDFLYNDLDEKGIHTFRDDDELRVGEEIGPELPQAIKESKISIPIFSQNYASSKWCLLELAQMVVCQKTMGQKILPIFYDVEPCDVQYQTGSYEEAFRQHEEACRQHKKGFNEKTVQEWREALREVGQLKGWELEKINNGHQGKLVKIVVEEVLSHLKKNYMVVTDNLVGIDHHIGEMKRLLNVDSNDVRIVGICGMGGLGKTTIAKFVYNELSEFFDCCCFLADVREMSQQDSSLVNLQKQLISKIRKSELPNITTVDEGIKTIEGIGCKKKVLIVLDDVDDKSQFAKLVGKHNRFGSGSRIIVTTRNKGVLNVLEVDETYEPQPMKLDDALQLFSKCAFRKNFPLEDYDDLSKKVVSTTGGLPLALEITGSFLFGKCEEVWEETLEKLKVIPHDQVQKQLRISYDALNCEEKQIFLDIACFFVGENKTLPFYMWNDCKYYPISGINILVLRSLVKIGDDNEFRMHDQLRDLGREIVCQQSTEDPGERSRLWIYEDALDVLDGQMGTNKVEALSLQTYLFGQKSGEHSFTNDDFGKLPNLRFLRVDCTDITGDFKNLLSKLRWLQWRKFTENSNPIKFHLKNLVILDLSYSCITENWEGWSQIKMATKLKVLDLSSCTGLTITPDFSTFVSLERLILKCCGKLVEIGPSIGNLINLRVLDISRSGIRKLPDALGGLEKLEEINASFCDDFGGVIPSSIGRLSSLRILMLHGTRICSLPMSICGLSLLQTLNLTLGRLNLTLDSRLGRDFLQSLPELPPSLRSLCLIYYFMETLSSLSNLTNLSDLKLIYCPKLKEIQGLECLESLRYLDASWCTSLKRLPDLSNLMNLSDLKLFQCHKLKEIQGLERLESLRYLDASGCISLKRLPDLSKLVMLKGLNLYGCKKLAEVRGLTNLKSLEKLDMISCTSLERLPDLSNLVILKELNLHECEKLVEVGGLTGLKSLENLDMRWCISLERLPDLSNLGMLKILNISQCKKLAEVGGLGGLKSLEILNMSWCNLSEGLLDLSNLKNLKELEICGWKNLIEVKGLEELESLEILDISDCRLFEKSLDLSNLQKLKKLKAVGCDNLPEIRGLEELEFLEIWRQAKVFQFRRRAIAL